MYLSPDRIAKAFEESHTVTPIPLDASESRLYRLRERKRSLFPFSFLLFLPGDSCTLQEGLSQIDRILGRHRLKDSIIWVTGSEEDAPMLFSDSRSTFIHFMTVGGGEVRFDWDFSYLGSRKIKSAMAAIANCIQKEDA